MILGKVNIREFGIKASIDGKGNVTNWETKFTQVTNIMEILTQAEHHY